MRPASAQSLRIVGATSFVLAVAAATAVPASAVTLAPHRAVYDMSLERASSGSGVTDITGRLAFELIGSPCDGYTVNMRFISQIHGEERTTTSDLQSATFEAGDGSSYRFVTRNHFAGGEAEVTDGMAERSGDDLAVALSSPQERQLDLSGGALFPTQHIRRILEAAEAGQAIFPAEVYDGSDGGQKLYQTTTAIGRKSTGADNGVGANHLADLPNWPVTIAYFDETAEDGGEVPTYEFSYSLYENGVSTELVLDYGNFAIRGELTSLELVDVEPCD